MTHIIQTSNVDTWWNIQVYFIFNSLSSCFCTLPMDSHLLVINLFWYSQYVKKKNGFNPGGDKLSGGYEDFTKTYTSGTFQCKYLQCFF